MEASSDTSVFPCNPRQIPWCWDQGSVGATPSFPGLPRFVVCRRYFLMTVAVCLGLFRIHLGPIRCLPDGVDGRLLTSQHFFTPVYIFQCVVNTCYSIQKQTKESEKKNPRLWRYSTKKAMVWWAGPFLFICHTRSYQWLNAISGIYEKSVAFWHLLLVPLFWRYFHHFSGSHQWLLWHDSGF